MPKTSCRLRRKTRSGFERLVLCPTASVYLDVAGWHAYSLLLSFAVVICWSSCPAPGASILLNDITASTGIGFKHTDGAIGRYHIIESVASGLALFDYDNDGDVDIYFLNGAPHSGKNSTRSGNNASPLPRNALYRNEGQWHFTDVTSAAGVGDAGYGLGVTVGDYDNDGDQDLYINNHGPNVLFRNNGNGAFTDVTQRAGVSNGSMMGAGANFLDADRDGDLDLFVSSYVEYDINRHVPTTSGGHPMYPGPDIYAHTQDTLFRNNGKGSFTDVSRSSGIGQVRGPGMGTVCGDIDNDGDTDIIVANDGSANFLFLNDGTGRFAEMGLFSGIAYDLNGEEQASMGADLGDYDNDGWLDLCMSSYQSERALLYRNTGDGSFEDVTMISGAATGTEPDVTWGTGFVDFDNDGDRDLFIVSGHIQDQIEHFDDRSTYYQTNKLYCNDGHGKFVNVSDQSGDGMKIRLSSRGAGFDDLDNDGDVDVVILNSRCAPSILRNDTPAQGHWLQIRVQARQSNRDGVGARVKVVMEDISLVDEVHSGRGYQSHYGTRLYFGLGKQNKIIRIEVAWIGGGTEWYNNINVDQCVVLKQGQGMPQRSSSRR